MSKHETLVEIKEKLTAGQTDEANELLSSIKVDRLTRNQKCELASIARRLGNPVLALKLLKPFVRSDNQLVQPKSDEILEYANALSAIGGASESIKLLNDKKVQEELPLSYLYLAFAQITCWHYESALDSLNQFLKTEPADSYRSQIARVNIIACKVSTNRFEEARDDLLKLLPELKGQEKLILYGNCLELLGQVYFQLKDYSESEKVLLEAASILEGKMPDWIYVQKWLCLIKLVRNPGQKESIEAINGVRDLAREYRDWETLRDIDLWLGVLAGKKDLTDKVFFGTPRETYKDRIEFFSPNDTSEVFCRWMGPRNENRKQISLSIFSEDWREMFPDYCLEQELFKVLLSDFYRPVGVTEIFFKIYPNEYYHPVFSINKVRVLVSRLRKVLTKLNLKITEIPSQGYILESEEPIELIYSRAELPQAMTKEEFYSFKIKNVFLTNWFSAKEFAQILGSSDRTSRRILARLIESGSILKEGKNKNAMYRINEAFAS